MTEDGRRIDGWLLDFADQNGIATYSTTNNKKIEKVDRRLYMAPKIAYAKIYKDQDKDILFSGKLFATEKEAAINRDIVCGNIGLYCIAKIELLDD